nr:immunoglobulin light chain junction region [Macaca mulatta]
CAAWDHILSGYIC